MKRATRSKKSAAKKLKMSGGPGPSGPLIKHFDKKIHIPTVSSKITDFFKKKR